MGTKAEISAKDMVLKEDHVLETASRTTSVPHKGRGILSLTVLTLSVRNLEKKPKATGAALPTRDFLV